MKLAYRVYIATLLLLAFAFSATAQEMKNPRSARDPRNTAPTVGTGGPVGGPTGLFTVYDGQVLRRGEFTFSAAYSNYDRDPGDVDITELPASFQVGLSDNFELFFSTDAYRAVKVNNPRNLSSFYLPNSSINGITPAAVVYAPSGPGTGPWENVAIFRPAGAPWGQYPYVGTSAGNYGLYFGSGPAFGFPANTNAILGPAVTGGNGADMFPGVGSVYGSILPGVVWSTACSDPTVASCPSGATSPTSFTTAPIYLPDAPFINRTYGESSFSTMNVGAKWRFTNVNNPVGFGVVGFYRYYMDRAKDFSGFNQLQRGASPGGNRGDIGASLFLDTRVAKWMNVSGNLGYTWNASVKGDGFTLLDRPDELLISGGADFPVNKYFQPIIEYRVLKYVGGRTPNALENNPQDFIGGVRIFPARWFGMGFAYRYHTNQQDAESWKNDDPDTGTVITPCVITNSPNCLPIRAFTFEGQPRGSFVSQNPHGAIFQIFAGRRNKRQGDIINIPANVDSLTISDTEVVLPCAPGLRAPEGQCNDNTTVTVSTVATDKENDVLTYNYTVSGGRIVGTGANVSWDLSGVSPGSYTITAGVDDGCGLCGRTQTQTVRVVECPNCARPCDCASISVSGPGGVTQPGEQMTFTANVSGGQASNLTYNWTVSAGEIVSGQGTSSITVATTRAMANSNVTATVTIGGQDPACDCPATANDSGAIAGFPEAVLIDEYGNIPNDQIRGRLDTFFADLANNPDSQGYVITYGTDRQARVREALIRNHMRLRSVDESRVTFVRGGVHESGTVYTKLYRVPAGAENPTP